MDKKIELSQKINELFATDQDFHAEQQNDGRYFKKAGKVTFAKIKNMLDNGGSIAVYQRSLDDRIKWICYDFDILKSQLEENNRQYAELELRNAVIKFCNFLNVKNITYLIEHSGNRGIHIWITFQNYIPFKIGHEITNLILEHAELHFNPELIAIDLFPHSSKITNSVGSCVKLPLSKHKKSESYSFFLKETTELNNITPITSLEETLLFRQNQILDDHKPITIDQFEKAFNVFLSQNHISYFDARVKSIVSDFSLDSLLEHWERELPLKKLSASIQNGTLNNQERKLLVGLLTNAIDINTKKIGKKVLLQIFEKQNNYNAEITTKAMHLLSSFYFPSKEQIEDIMKERFSTNINNQNLLNVIFNNVISHDQGHFEFCNTDIEIVRHAEMKYLIQNDEAQSRKVINQLYSIKAEDYLTIINSFINSYSIDKLKYYKHERQEVDKVRELISLECLERMVTSMTLKQLHHFYNLPYNNSSHGYKVNKGFKDGYIFEPWLYLWIQFLSNISSSITNEENSEYYIIKTDISSFYNKIDHDKLKRMLLNSSPINGIKEKLSKLDDNSITNYKRLITICLDIAKKTVGSNEGLPQGPAYARFFAELYLSDIDNKFETLLTDESIILYQRYVDDIFIICKSEQEATEKLTFLGEELSKLGLTLKPSKTLIKKVKDFSPDYDKYRSQSKYSVDRISSKYSTATNEEKSHAINEFINLIQSDTKQDDYSFIFSHLKGVQEVEPFKNNEIPNILESGIGRGSLYRNLFIHILDDENNWHYLTETNHFNSIQSEVLTSTIINYIEEGKSSHSKFNDLMSNIHNKFTLTKMVEEHLLQMNLLIGFGIDYTKIPASTIIDVISAFPLKLNIETTNTLLDYINTELNSMHDKYKFMNVMYAITHTSKINKIELNKLSSLFFSYITLHMNETEFKKKNEEINESVTFTIKYHYLVSLFSLSREDKSHDLLINMWKYCACLFNSIDQNVNEKVDYGWIHKITSIDLDTEKLYVLLSSIVDGEIFRGVVDNKSIFKTYHALLLIRLSDKITALNLNEMDTLLKEISKESKFYEWIINREHTDLIPNTRAWFDNNIIYNNTIMLKRGSQVLIRKPHELFRTTEKVDIGEDGYSELIENYNTHDLSTITSILSQFDLKKFIEFLTNELEKTNIDGLPNIFSYDLIVKRNSLEPFTNELYSPRFFIFEESNKSVSIKDCSKKTFVELMFKKYAEAKNISSIEIYERYISKLPIELEIDIFLRHLSRQFEAFHEMDDMSSSVLLDLSVASALYCCLREQHSPITSFEKFTDFYIPNDVNLHDLHVFSVDDTMSINDSSPKEIIDSILSSIITTKSEAYPYLILDIEDAVSDYLKSLLKIITKDENYCPANIDSFIKCQVKINPIMKTIEIGSDEKFNFSHAKVINYTNETIDDLSLNNTHYLNSASHVYKSVTEGMIYLIALPSALSKAFYYIDNKFKLLTPQKTKSYHSYEINRANIINLNKFEHAVNVIKTHKSIDYQDAKELLVKWLSTFPEKYREIFVLIISSHQYMMKSEVNSFCETVLELINSKQNAMMIKKLEDFNGTIRCFHTNTELSRKLGNLNPNNVDMEKSNELSIIADVIISGTQICKAMTFYLTGAGKNDCYFDHVDTDSVELKIKLKKVAKIKICCILYTHDGIANILKSLKDLMPALSDIEVIHGRSIDGNAFFGTTVEIGNTDKQKIIKILCDEEQCKLIYSYLRHPQVRSKEFRNRYVLTNEKIKKINLVARFQSLPKMCFDFLYLGLKTNHGLHPMDRVLESNDMN